jgi:uncharacterized protein (TIGR00661 family)
MPISQENFTQSMIHCHGVITGAGFETPAEALVLKKKLMVLPIHGQYEQICNAEALKEWKVNVQNHLKNLELAHFTEWYENSEPKDFNLLYSNREIVEYTVNSTLNGFG